MEEECVARILEAAVTEVSEATEAVKAPGEAPAYDTA